MIEDTHLEANSIGMTLRERRKELALTQDQLAQKLGVRRQTIADLENGKNVGSHLLLNAMGELKIPFELKVGQTYQVNKSKGAKKALETPSAFQISTQFDFPYDWSNPGNLSDDVLIIKVLKSLRFADIVRLCKKFGVARVDEEIRSSLYDNIRDDLNQMMAIVHRASQEKVA